MSLNIQIKTIVLSLLYGIFIYYLLFFNKKILYNKKLFIKIIGTLSIVILITLLYFLLLKNINNGYFHIYELLLIIMSYSLIALKHKKWYNFYGDNMSKKMPKKAKKRLIIFGIPCILIILYFFLQLFLNIYKIYDLKVEQHKLTTELNDLKKEEKEKRIEIEKYETEDGMGGYIRKQYSYSKNNEYIIKMKDSDKTKEKELSFTEYIKNMVSNINIDYPYIIFGSIAIIVFIIILTSKKKSWQIVK